MVTYILLTNCLPACLPAWFTISLQPYLGRRGKINESGYDEVRKDSNIPDADVADKGYTLCEGPVGILR